MTGRHRPASASRDETSRVDGTINADDQELMRHFHKPGEEKRMVVILEEAEYDAWLDCPPERMMSFMRQYPTERLEAEASPRPPR